MRSSLTGTSTLDQVAEVSIIPPKAPEESARSIGVSLPEHMWQKLQEIADVEKRKRNEIIKILLEHAIREYEAEKETGKRASKR